MCWLTGHCEPIHHTLQLLTPSYWHYQASNGHTLDGTFEYCTSQACGTAAQYQWYCYTVGLVGPVDIEPPTSSYIKLQLGSKVSELAWAEDDGMIQFPFCTNSRHSDSDLTQFISTFTPLIALWSSSPHTPYILPSFPPFVFAFLFSLASLLRSSSKLLLQPFYWPLFLSLYSIRSHLII